MTDLSVDRLFDAPSLAGSVPISVKIFPDGSRVTFLKGKEVDKDCLDLWEFDVDSGTARLLVHSTDLKTSKCVVPEIEQTRRERQRAAALSGIVDYLISPKGNALLIPLAGELFYCNLRSSDPEIQRIPTSAAAIDPTISPDSSHLAYVSAYNLMILKIEGMAERALTSDGGGCISNGLAEFIAQEEMDRSSGYWWSPDGGYIAFIRSDESRVNEAVRFEISGDNIETRSQRYPVAGSTNSALKIGVVEVESGEIAWMDLGIDDDVYVARVNWLPDSTTLAIQRQTRDQKRLDLVFCDIETGKCRVVLSEFSDSWIELHQELTFLERSPEFIWASNRTGFMHLYLYRTDGSLISQLTSGDWCVDDFRGRAICCVDETEGVVYFLSTAKSPLERHLYRTNIRSGETRQITQEAGVHSITMLPAHDYYVDSYHSASHPPRVGMYDRSGTLKCWIFENKLDATHPSAPYLASNATTEFGQLTAADGQQLYYRLFKPYNFDAAKRYPAIIEVYGGPGVQRVLNSWSGSTFTQVLTRAGYVVMMLDNRGSAHRGTGFQAPIAGRLGEVEVTDQLTGANWLASQAYIDPGRLGVWGWSYGGYLTLMLLFKSRKFKAGVSGAPVTDWRLYDTHYTERFLGMPRDNEAGYQLSSVIENAAMSSRALLLIHGMADDNVLFTHSTKLVRRLQDLNKPFEIMVYPGGKHGLLRLSDGRHAYNTMLKFFDRAL